MCIYLGLITISCGAVKKSRSTGFIISIDSKYTAFRTLLKYLLTVSLECWNLSCTSLLKAPNAKV